MELGMTTFGETTPLETTGIAPTHPERIRQLVQEIELADRVGLDVYGIGEHHREDFAVSAPEMVLAAGAVNTKHIKLTSAATIISSNDPVRVYQNFATLDALSNGRAEVMVGRGSFIESFPLFGYNLNDYDELFDEKLAMLRTIQEKSILDWKGNFTQSVDHRGVYPRADFPIWVATGGNVESTIKIAQQGLPITYAIIGGNPLAFKPLIDAYREIGSRMGHNLEKMKVAAHSWGFIAETDEEAQEKYFYPTKVLVDQIAKERSHWNGNFTWEDYQQAIGPEGAMFVGSPETVAKKIRAMKDNLGLDRFMLHLPIGSMPHEDVMKSIELLGSVAPMLR